MRLVLMLYGKAICVGLCSHIKTVIGRVTYEIGVDAILNSFCAGLCSHPKTVIGRVTYEIGVDAIRNSHLRRPLFTYKNSDWYSHI